MSNVFSQLKRRNVFRVGAAYAVVAWVAVQIGEAVFPAFGVPDGLFRGMVILLALGFPAALVLAWAFEVTPEGVKREREVGPEQSITRTTGRKLDRFVIALLIFGIVYFAFDKFSASTDSTSQHSAVEATSAAPPPAGPEAVQQASIAVLPFADLSPDGDQEFFSDGISEELLNLLTRVDGLQVASRTSSFAFKGQSLGIAEIARELEVNLVLEGSVRKSGNKVRITAQLIDADNDRHLWSETYDRQLDDIFEIQDQIAASIVLALRNTLGAKLDPAAARVKVPTSNLDAYSLFLKARELFIKRTEMKESVALFRQAVALDPGFARGWEGLAAALVVAPSWSDEGSGAYEESRLAAERALELDPSLSLAYGVLGLLDVILDSPPDYKRVFEQYTKGIANNPNETSVILWQGMEYNKVGFFDKAIDSFDRCLKIDPGYINCMRQKLRSLIYLNDRDGAMALYEQIVRTGWSTRDSSIAPLLLSRGERLAAMLAMLSEFDSKGFPVGLVLDAMESPGVDHSAVLQRIEGFLKGQGDRIEDSSFVLFALGVSQRVDPNASRTMGVWNPGFPGLRGSKDFKRILNAWGIPDYWRETGFPPQCRPLGDKDFECD